MISLNDKISVRQMQALLMLDVFGTGATYLPRIAAQYSAQDGWISVLISTAIAVIYAYIITLITGMFPGKTFYDYCCAIISKPIGTIICFALSIKIILNCGLELRLFGEIIRETMLNFTPLWVICGTMLFLGAFIAAKGYETRARIAEILFFIVFIPLIIFFAIASLDVDFSNILPIFEASPKDLLKGGTAGVFSFASVELLLIGLPYINRNRVKGGSRGIQKGIIGAVVLIGLFMSALTLITIARFGANGVMRQMWPVLEMMDTIDLPGAFIERQDALILSFWIISSFAIVNANLFFSSLLLKDAIGRGRHSWWILSLIPIIILIAYLPDNILKAFEFMNTIYRYAGLGFFIFMPLILLIMAKVRRLDKNV